MTVGIFENAPTKVKGQPAKPVREKTTLVEGLEMYTSMSVVCSALAAKMAPYARNIKTFMQRRALSEILKTHKRPANFFGSEGNSIASLQLRKRSSADALDEKEHKVFVDCNIPVQTITEYTINSKYCDTSVPANVRRLRKVSVAIEKALGSNCPDDFIVSTTKTIVTDDTLEAICFGRRSKAETEMLLGLATTLAIGKPELVRNTTDNVHEAYDQAYECLFEGDDPDMMGPVFTTKG